MFVSLGAAGLSLLPVQAATIFLLAMCMPDCSEEQTAHLAEVSNRILNFAEMLPLEV